MTKAYLITRCVLDVIYEQRERVFHWNIQTRENNGENTSSICLFKSADQNILFRLDSFEKPYKQACVSPGYPNTRKPWTKTLALHARVFTIVFSCLDIPVKHSLSLLIYYIKHVHLAKMVSQPVKIWDRYRENHVFCTLRRSTVSKQTFPMIHKCLAIIFLVKSKDGQHILRYQINVLDSFTGSLNLVLIQVTD